MLFKVPVFALPFVMRIKKTIGTIHLWLGLSSGLIVCFLGLTGCILAFQQEIESVTVPEQYVTPEALPFLPPSLLKTNAEKSLTDNRKIVSVDYPGRARAAQAFYYTENEYFLVYLNPYSGKVLRVRNMNRDFFRIVINGHYYLWLPPSVGQPILASATLVFVIMMITGIILWWPKNKAARKQRFSIKWNARWRRVNYDLHNVLGFYVALLALVLACSGLVMGFQWFAKSVYFISSGETMPPFPEVQSDTTLPLSSSPYASTDAVFFKMLPAVHADEGIGVEFPPDQNGSIELSINHRPGTYYNRDNYYFDQYTLQQINVRGVYAGKYADASVADKLQRMNYDIHVGAIGGLPTKILAFGASFIAASLPVSGFLLWRGRNKKKQQQPKAARHLVSTL